MLLEGKRILVTGVLDHRSLAYSIAEVAQKQGAEIVLTGFGRAKRITERAAERLPSPPDVLELDVTVPDDFAALREDLDGRWGALDGVVHSIAFAPQDAISGDFLGTPRESATQAFEISAYSLKALVEAVLPLLEGATKNGGSASVLGLDFDAQMAWPSYDWMGVSKAALESVSRYLARDLGPRRVRVNLIACGPVRTVAASNIENFDGLLEDWIRRAPLGWDAEDRLAVAGAAAFMLSDLSRAITGEVLHVDGGVHAMGSDVPKPPS
jgi:meromycolic acid enoyl-[acyl-carrier-protein] reductase